MNEAAVASSFSSWKFVIPVVVAKHGVQIAIYGQDPKTERWLYWNSSKHDYRPFSNEATGPDASPIIVAASSKETYTQPVSFEVNLPAAQHIRSGVVVMFIGPCNGVPVTKGVPGSPTTDTNPNDLYSLFEFTYMVPDKAASQAQASLDIDISNVDQVGFTYTVESSSAPFPLTRVGSSLPQRTLFDRFAADFPVGHPFHECLVYGKSDEGKQVRVLAPQDVLQAVRAPNTPSYANPSGTPKTGDPFTEHTYWYKASESSPSGETAASPKVFGGFLRDSHGQPSASEIEVGWGAPPARYTPINPSATKINLYRATAHQADAPSSGTAYIPEPTTGFELLTSQTLDDWNAQPGTYFADTELRTATTGTKSLSYGFSALCQWFDRPLEAFFDYYTSNTFALYQFNQHNGSNGTLWTGKVVDVTPQKDDHITTMTFVDKTGAACPITTTWSWGTGQTYRVLQLVGNAYDAGNVSETSVAGKTHLRPGEYEGAVLNVYFPYFTGNTGLASIDLKSGRYELPGAPTWMKNAENGPSHMVFGCSGVFATAHDRDAKAQSKAFPALASNALANIENVIVSALNRGIATGYQFAVKPQQYTSLFGFSEAPTVAAHHSGIPKGTYTYYLSGTLNDGSESALSWGQTIRFDEPSAVTLVWLPQDISFYAEANVYRRQDAGTIELVGTIPNISGSKATSFTDRNEFADQHAPLSGKAPGAPYLYYPSWQKESAPDYVASNLFSAFLHQDLDAGPSGISFNGLVYGYPFDDQGNFSTNINYGATLPDSVSFRISDLT